MKKIAVSLLTLVAITGTAYAADPPIIIDEPIAIDNLYDWNGFYFGLKGGWAAGTANFDFPDVGTGVDVPLSGWLLGVVGGAGWQSDMFYLGVEGEVSWTNISGTTLCPNPGFDCAVNTSWLADGEIQVGAAFEQALFYVHGGIAAAALNATTAPFPTGTFDGTAIGYVVGAGLKFAVAENVVLVGEYSYYNLSAQAPLGTLSGISVTDLNPTFHVVSVGVNWTFD